MFDKIEFDGIQKCNIESYEYFLYSCHYFNMDFPTQGGESEVFYSWHRNLIVNFNRDIDTLFNGFLLGECFHSFTVLQYSFFFSRLFFSTNWRKFTSYNNTKGVERIKCHFFGNKKIKEAENFPLNKEKTDKLYNRIMELGFHPLSGQT